MTYPKVREGCIRLTVTLVIPQEVWASHDKIRRRKAKKTTEYIRDLLIEKYESLDNK
jgi:hypothetical protein